MPSVSVPCVGDGLAVPLVDGRRVAYANLDLAASAPALVAVRDAVDEFLPWYSSVHRGTGFASLVSTEAYESSRRAVAAFVRSRDDDVVIFTRNTTDAANLLGAALPDGVEILAFATEHHANLLPWRRRAATFLPPPVSPASAIADLESALGGGRQRRPRLVAVSGASNVTGEVWPVGEIVRVAHDAGARVFLDAAQLAPHHPIDMRDWDVDYLAMSGHKLYAPYGAGVLVGRRDWLESTEPFLAGGGAVQLVTTDRVSWAAAPERQEAGSPNVVGAVALATACHTLQQRGMAQVAADEQRLLARLQSGLDDLPGVSRYSMWGGDSGRIGVVTFTVAGIPSGLVAAVLSAEHGIGVRHGCFCAHPLMLHLLGVDESRAERMHDDLQQGCRPAMPGAVRASIGAPTSVHDVERLVEALHALIHEGPSWDYRRVPGSDDFVPVPDTRPRPLLRATRTALGVLEPAG